MLALTATATPPVQADIVSQLEMPHLTIHPRLPRDNLAIEVVELPIPQRVRQFANLLTKRARSPAIVYATSRKQSETLAEELRGG